MKQFLILAFCFVSFNIFGQASGGGGTVQLKDSITSVIIPSKATNTRVPSEKAVVDLINLNRDTLMEVEVLNGSLKLRDGTKVWNTNLKAVNIDSVTTTIRTNPNGGKVTTEKAVRDALNDLSLAGVYRGSATTLAALNLITPKVNRDIASLTIQDGLNPPGIYMVGTSGNFQLVKEIPDVGALTTAQITDIANTINGTISGQSFFEGWKKHYQDSVKRNIVLGSSAPSGDPDKDHKIYIDTINKNSYVSLNRKWQNLQNYPLIPTVQAGLGSNLELSSLDKLSNVHINSNVGNLTWNVSTVKDGQSHYLMNVGLVTSQITFNNYTKVYLRNGIAENELTTGVLIVKAGESYFIHVTNNTGDKYINIIKLSGESGLSKNGLITGANILSKDGVYGFDGGGNIPISNQNYPDIDLVNEPWSANNGWGNFVIGYDPSSNYGQMPIGIVRKIRIRTVTSNPNPSQVRLYNNNSAVSLVSSSTLTNRIALADNVYEFDLVSPISVTNGSQMLALDLSGITLYTEIVTGFTIKYISGTGAPTSTQTNRKTSLQFVFEINGTATPIEITLPPVANVGQNSLFVFHEVGNSDLQGAVLKVATGQTLNGVVNGSILMKSKNAIWLAIGDNIDGYAATQIVGSSTDGNNVFLVRSNSTANISPTNLEISTPINGDNAIIFLNNGTVEYWSYNTSWSLTRSINVTYDGKTVWIVRTNSTRNTPPTNLEFASPKSGDVAVIFLTDAVKEYWTYTTSWAVTHTDTRSSTITVQQGQHAFGSTGTGLSPTFTVSFPTAFSNIPNIQTQYQWNYNVTTNGTANSPTIAIESVTTTGFTYRITGGRNTLDRVFWLASDPQSVIPESTPTYTPRNITGDITATAFDGRKDLFSIPLSADEQLDNVTVTTSNATVSNINKNGTFLLEPTGSGNINLTKTTSIVATRSRYFGTFTNQAGDGTGHSFTERLKRGSGITTSNNIDFTVSGGIYRIEQGIYSHYTTNTWRTTGLRINGSSTPTAIIRTGSDGASINGSGPLVWYIDATTQNVTFKFVREGSTGNGNADGWLDIVREEGVILPTGFVASVARTLTISGGTFVGGGTTRTIFEGSSYSFKVENGTQNVTGSSNTNVAINNATNQISGTLGIGGGDVATTLTFSNLNAYSTSEASTNETWIDNRSIFRRTFTGTTPNNSSDNTLFTLANVSLTNVIKIEGVYTQTNNRTSQLGYSGNAAHGEMFQLYENGVNLEGHWYNATGDSRHQNTPYKITIYYVK